MTRIGVMTFLHNDNYGSILQAWALQQTLVDLGFDAEHIDYSPSKKEKMLNLLRSGNSPRLILEGMRKRRATGKMHGGFEEFRASCIRTSPVCYDRAALRRQSEAYDLLLCGSDQIWSPVWLNPAYFLDFTKKPRIAYAPSLGVSEMPDRRKQRRMARLLKGFAALSVREAEGAALIARLTGLHAEVLPDPVMLIPGDRWRAVMSEKTDRKYVLCYFIGDRADYWEQVKAAAEREGCSVLVIPRTEGARSSGYTLEENVPPQRWLALIDGAARVVTDSFHGAAFSAILNTPCTILRRYSEDDRESKNSRIDQLLRNLDTDELAPENWPVVNARLAALANKGRTWLTDEISRAAKTAPRAAEK